MVNTEFADRKVVGVDHVRDGDIDPVCRETQGR